MALLKIIAYILWLMSLTFIIESAIALFWTGESTEISKQYSSIIFSMHQIRSLPSRLALTKYVAFDSIGARDVTRLECPLKMCLDLVPPPDLGSFAYSLSTPSTSIFLNSTNFLRWMSPKLCAVTKNFYSLKTSKSVMKSSLIEES